MGSHGGSDRICPKREESAGFAYACGVHSQKCFFAKARPEWGLRYFSKPMALSLVRKAMAVSVLHGRNFDVCGLPGIVLAQTFRQVPGQTGVMSVGCDSLRRMYT